MAHSPSGDVSPHIEEDAMRTLLDENGSGPLVMVTVTVHGTW